MKAKIVTFLATAGALVAPSGAEAHISLHPNTIPAGAFATLDLRVPGERKGAHVEKVDVLFPAGFIGVAYENVAGWSIRVIESKLAKPIQTDDGPVDSEVSQIIWSWRGPLGQVNDGQFIDLPLSVAIPAADAGRTLEFRTVQTYSDGKVVRWIDPALEAENPSPRIDVTAKGGAIEDLAGDEAGPVAGQAATGVRASPAAKPAAGASNALAIAALAIGVLGLLTGAGALAATRRRDAAQAGRAADGNSLKNADR
jgi:uncharacterized protein